MSDTDTPITDEAWDCTERMEGAEAECYLRKTAEKLERENAKLREELKEELTMADNLAAALRGDYDRTAALSEWERMNTPEKK